MTAYQMHEADLQVPDNWKDTTINAFVLPSATTAGAADATFVVTRDAESESKSVTDYADLQLVEAAKRLTRYKLIERRATQVSDQAAMEVNYTWWTPERIEIRQRQVYVRYTGFFLIFTLTARASDFARYEPSWQSAVQSVRLRRA